MLLQTPLYTIREHSNGRQLICEAKWSKWVMDQVGEGIARMFIANVIPQWVFIVFGVKADRVVNLVATLSVVGGRRCHTVCFLVNIMPFTGHLMCLIIMQVMVVFG